MSTTAVRSETGRLRAVMLHRPGRELERLTPRNNDELLFDGLPWLPRAQTEHDAFVAQLEQHGVEVLLLGEMLRQVLAEPSVHEEAVAGALDGLALDDALTAALVDHLQAMHPDELAETLAAGIRNDELHATGSLLGATLPPDAFLLEPLPNLYFARDSSFCIGRHPVVSSLATTARRRESLVTSLVMRHHPRFAGCELLHTDPLHPVEGGDVLVLGDGVVAIGMGQRTSASGVQQLAATLFAAGAVHTVLAVPIPVGRATMHLDTVCTVVDRGLLVGMPGLAQGLQAFTLTGDEQGVRVQPPRGLLEAAGEALGVELRLVPTTMDAVVAEREQWDDAFNTLALEPGVVFGYERNTATIDALGRAGVEVLPISGTELGSGRGGPRCMSCPVERDPL